MAGIKSLAQQVQGKGRGYDTHLVHITEDELQGLRALAQQHGGDLTVNPTTGLYEVGFLSGILPTLVGAGVGIFTGNPYLGAAAGAAVGGAQNKDDRLGGALMGGLGGFGGAGLTSGLATAGASGAAGTAVDAGGIMGGGIGMGSPVAAPEMVTYGAEMADPSIFSSAVTPDFSQIAVEGIDPMAGMDEVYGASGEALRPASGGAMQGVPSNTSTRWGDFTKGAGDTFSSWDKTKDFLSNNKMNMLMAAAPMLSQDTQTGAMMPTQNYGPGPKYKFNPATNRYEPAFQQMQPAGFQRMAGGGIAGLAGGGAPQQGRLMQGPGNGVSDSIPATIGGRQPAALADGEFVVPARVVSELGNGSTQAGARELYKMIDRVQQARAKNSRKGKVANKTHMKKVMPV